MRRQPKGGSVLRAIAGTREVGRENDVSRLSGMRSIKAISLPYFFQLNYLTDGCSRPRRAARQTIQTTVGQNSAESSIGHKVVVA